jgi:hypothetical protein
VNANTPQKTDGAIMANVVRLLIGGVLGICLWGCGAPASQQHGLTPDATAASFLARWAAQDSAGLAALLTSDGQQALGPGGAADWISRHSRLYGPPRAQGQITTVQAGGDTAQVDVNAVFACAACRTPPPTWAPAGTYVETVHLTLQRGGDGVWRIALVH